MNRKILLVSLILFLLFPTNIYGESIKKSKCYKEEKEYVGLLSKEGNINNYTLYDEIKYEYGEWNNYNESINLPDNIEVKDIYTYKNLHKVKYLFIREIDVYNDPLKIDEIKIFNKGELINYNTMCYGCNPYNLEYFNDNNLENTVGIIRNGSVIITFDKEYNPWDIKVEIYYNKTNSEKFLIWLSQYNSPTQAPIIEYKESFNEIKNNYMKTYIFNGNMIKSEIYSDQEFNTNHLLNDWYSKLIDSKKLYREVVTKYNYYKLNKVYLDNNYYEICPEEYISDSSDYITVVRNEKSKELENIIKPNQFVSEIVPNKIKTNQEKINARANKIENKILNSDNNFKIEEKIINKNNNIIDQENKIIKDKEKNKTIPIIITICLIGLSALIIKFKL